MNVINRVEQVDEQKWGHFSSFRVSFSSYDPEIVQKSVFFTVLC